MGYFSDRPIAQLLVPEFEQAGRERNRPPGFAEAMIYRLDRRFDHIMRPHRHRIRDKRVLDLASHEGRWSWAALELGAASIVGIEARSELVATANDRFSTLGIERDRYRFVTGDLFEEIDHLTGPIDTVLCLGFFYHTADHAGLMRKIARLSPETIIIDTNVASDDQPVIRLRFERVDDMMNAAASEEGQERALIGKPSRQAMRLLGRSVGYRTKEVPWNEVDADRGNVFRSVDEYLRGERAVFVLSPRPPEDQPDSGTRP